MRECASATEVLRGLHGDRDRLSIGEEGGIRRCNGMGERACFCFVSSPADSAPLPCASSGPVLSVAMGGGVCGHMAGHCSWLGIQSRFLVLSALTHTGWHTVCIGHQWVRATRDIRPPVTPDYTHFTRHCASCVARSLSAGAFNSSTCTPCIPGTYSTSRGARDASYLLLCVVTAEILCVRTYAC